MTEPPGQTTSGSNQSERDAETARLLLASDTEGLRRLVADHGGRVKATLHSEFKKLLDHLEIDDALNQATHRVWRARTRLDLSRGTLRAWYQVIARNCSLRLLTAKRGPNALRFVDDLEAVSPQPGPTETSSVEALDRRRALYEAIDKLPAQPRAVLLADLAAGGMADTKLLMEQLGTTANSIYVARATGLKAVRAILAAQGYPPREDEGEEGGGREARRAMP